MARTSYSQRSPTPRIAIEGICVEPMTVQQHKQAVAVLAPLISAWAEKTQTGHEAITRRAGCGFRCRAGRATLTTRRRSGRGLRHDPP
jgi:hypothetical protein